MRGSSSSCRDGFRLHDGLLPQRGGEGVQTHQCRDRETTPARQARRKTGAEAAAAGYVTAGGPAVAPGSDSEDADKNSKSGPYLLYLYFGKLK